MMPFQSTPLCKGRQVTKTELFSRLHFNPRPCARGDKTKKTWRTESNIFQSTPLCKGRPTLIHDEISATRFQSTPLCKGRLRLLCKKRDFSAVLSHSRNIYGIEIIQNPCDQAENRCESKSFFMRAYGSHLKNQGFLRIIRLFCTKIFYLTLVFSAEMIYS